GRGARRFLDRKPQRRSRQAGKRGESDASRQLGLRLLRGASLSPAKLPSGKVGPGLGRPERAGGGPRGHPAFQIGCRLLCREHHSEKRKRTIAEANLEITESR